MRLAPRAMWGAHSPKAPRCDRLTRVGARQPDAMIVSRVAGAGASALNPQRRNSPIAGRAASYN
jgi:hypothetical protein